MIESWRGGLGSTISWKINFVFGDIVQIVDRSRRKRRGVKEVKMCQ